jgi:hypothetical protein
MRGFGYADLTGNLRLSLSKPALFIETRGADENPTPDVRDRRSLKGAKAGRLVRALCDFRPPLGLRELATRAGVDAGYASRIVESLGREALVVRDKRGPIRTVDWPALLRRWSQEYSPFQPDRIRWYLAARGLGPLIERIRTFPIEYAVSGSWAATQLAAIAPPRLLICYTDFVPDLAKALDVRPTEAGANVALVVLDPVVFERTLEKKGVRVAAVSQIAADLLTSPGRGPNEAEALAKRDARQAAEAERGKNFGGRPPQIPDPAQATPEPTAQRNFTDPDSRIMKDGATKRVVQAYHAQAAVDATAQVIVACAIAHETNDKPQWLPMLHRVEENVGRTPTQVTADAG